MDRIDTNNANDIHTSASAPKAASASPRLSFTKYPNARLNFLGSLGALSLGVTWLLPALCGAGDDTSIASMLSLGRFFETLLGSTVSDFVAAAAAVLPLDAVK